MIEIKNENEDYQISGYISYPELQKVIRMQLLY